MAYADLTIAARDAIVAADLDVSGVYIAGGVPEGATLPYLTILPDQTTTQRLADRSFLVSDTIVVDIYDWTLIGAMALSDTVESELSGLSVAAEDETIRGIAPDGTWRDVLGPVASPEGKVFYRISVELTYERLRKSAEV